MFFFPCICICICIYVYVYVYYCCILVAVPRKRGRESDCVKMERPKTPAEAGQR